MGVGVNRIVLAEDDAAYAAVLEGLLQADGRFEVVGRACNGREAIELVRKLEPDAVVMDIEMPEVDGVEATRAVSATVPVLAISGHEYEERVLDIRTAGAADYVRKARIDEELCDALFALVH